MHKHAVIDVPKTLKSMRVLALGALTDRYRTGIAKLANKRPNDWVFPNENDPKNPRWESGVRQVLKRAARKNKKTDDKNDPGFDFAGFGPHSLRRANITWRQEFGSSLEATSSPATPTGAPRRSTRSCRSTPGGTDATGSAETRRQGRRD